MTTTETTTTTTDTTPAPAPAREFNAPQLSKPLAGLFSREEIFVSTYQAQAWIEQFGHEVLRDQALEAVTNLLSASSEERRNRGQLVLERAILAQAAWLALFELMAPCGRIDQLKRLTSAVRDKDSSLEEHRAAREATLEAFEEFSARRREADELIGDIVELAREETFIFSARAGSITGNRGQAMGLYPWQVECLDTVLAGDGYRVAVKSLSLTAERLDLLSRIFFGETTSGNGGAKTQKGRSARKIAKSERDKAIRAARQQPKGAKPQKGHRN